MAKKLNLASYKRKSSQAKDAPKVGDKKKLAPAKSDTTEIFSEKEPKENRSDSTGHSQSTRTERLSRPESKDSQSTRIEPAESKDSRSSSTERSRSEGIRLNRYIAHCGVCSRREADQLIADGKIKVNKKIITEMGYKVMPGDNVFYGKKLLKKEDYAYVLLNKPKNFITTTKDTHDRKTVMDLVEKAADARLYPVGRLDRNTTGLLLLTNDGELTDRLSHPSNNIKKIYQVEINKPILKEHFEEIVKGFTLEDGPIAIDDIAILTADNKSIGIEIHSGRNRIVRRIFEHFDYDVTKLDRVVYAGLTKVNLPRGKWRHLNDREIGLLKKKGKKR